MDFRLELYREVSDAHYAEAAAFYESAGGQALQEAVREAALRLILPEMVRGTVGEWPTRPAVSADIFDVVDQQPELIGGIEALQRAVVYPALAREAGIQGRVFVQFVVDETGQIVDPTVMRSPSQLLSDAALAAVMAQRFRPGSQRGRTVKVRYMLPINFVLTDDPPPATPPKQSLKDR